MRCLLRCLRGEAAFAAVIALVPLIGAIANQAVTVRWYATKSRAQIAGNSGSTATPDCPVAKSVGFIGSSASNDSRCPAPTYPILDQSVTLVS
jgi:hypothetical protein